MEEKDLVIDVNNASNEETNVETETNNEVNSNEELETLKAQLIKAQQDNAKLKKSLDLLKIDM